MKSDVLLLTDVLHTLDNLLDKKSMCFIMKTYTTLLKIRIKVKNNESCIRIQSITMAKTIC